LTNSRITKLIESIQELTTQVDVQANQLPLYFGDAPYQQLRSHCERFVGETTAFLTDEQGVVKKEIVVSCEEMEKDIRSTLLVFDPQTEESSRTSGNQDGEIHSASLGPVLTGCRINFIRPDSTDAGRKYDRQTLWEPYK
jgi:hypothetical protein